MYRTVICWLAALMIVPLCHADESLRGLVNVSVACMRAEPRHGSELVSQAVMGTPLRLLARADGWWRVQSPDGYEAYMIDNSLVVRDSLSMNGWKSAPRLVVTSSDQISITDADGRQISDAVNGCIVEYKAKVSDELSAVTLPDGREGYVKNAQVEPVEQWACQPFNPDRIIETGRSMMGTPYLWGGMSTKALDCSGFVRVCYMANGRLLRRDASQQAEDGAEIRADADGYKRGDLLFFGNRGTGRINHVAISTGGMEFIHCSGRVMRGSLDPASEDYSRLYFIKAVRPWDEASKTVRIAEHPWYFNLSPMK